MIFTMDQGGVSFTRFSDTGLDAKEIVVHGVGPFTYGVVAAPGEYASSLYVSDSGQVLCRDCNIPYDSLLFDFSQKNFVKQVTIDFGGLVTYCVGTPCGKNEPSGIVRNAQGILDGLLQRLSR